MKNSILLIIALFLASCATQKKCLEKYPPETFTRIDSVFIEKEKLIIRDTLVYIELPGDTVKFTDTVRIEAGQVILKPVVKETERTKVTASVVNNRLVLEVVEKPLIIEKLLKGVIQERDFYKELSKKEAKTEIIREKFIPTWVKYLSWLGAIFIFILIFVVLRFFKVL